MFFCIFFHKSPEIGFEVCFGYIGESLPNFKNHEILVRFLLYKKAKKVHYNLTTYVIYFSLVFTLISIPLRQSYSFIPHQFYFNMLIYTNSCYGFRNIIQFALKNICLYLLLNKINFID